MGRNYEEYDGEVYGGVLYDGALVMKETDERLEDLQTAIDGVCEMLERVLERLAVFEKGVEKEKESGFRLAKVGADIGEEVGRMDEIARIFGNIAEKHQRGS